MKTQAAPRWIVAFCILAVAGCSRGPATGPEPATPVPEPSEFRFDVRFTYADGRYTVRNVVYADPNGVVREVDYRPPVWNRTMKLESGDRLYLRAEVEYESGLAGIVQISGPAGFYRSEQVASLDGPTTVVLQIDEQVK